MARHTSTKVYRQIVAEGLLSKMRFAVYDLLYHDGPLTGAELDEMAYAAGGRGHYHKRLPELRDLGVVREVGEQFCTVSGRKVIAWDVTAHLPIGAAVGKTKYLTQQEARDALESLKAVWSFSTKNGYAGSVKGLFRLKQMLIRKAR